MKNKKTGRFHCNLTKRILQVVTYFKILWFNLKKIFREVVLN